GSPGVRSSARFARGLWFSCTTLRRSPVAGLHFCPQEISTPCSGGFGLASLLHLQLARPGIAQLLLRRTPGNRKTRAEGVGWPYQRAAFHVCLSLGARAATVSDRPPGAGGHHGEAPATVARDPHHR